MLNSRTKLYGVIGSPIAHSISPKLHNGLFRYYGLNAVYLAFDVKDIAEAFHGIRGLGLGGVNITLPYKERTLGLVDKVDADAEAVGAVNTVKNNGGILYGYNTDVFGFEETLRRIDYLGKEITVVGAGGAARAVIYALYKLGVKRVNLMNRTMDKAAKLREQFERIIEIDCHRLDAAHVVGHTDVLINATSVGIDGISLPVDIAPMGKGWVVDIIYFDTPLVKKARSKRLDAINGMVMFVNQAIRSFEIWTGIKCSECLALSLLGEKV